MFEAGRFTLVLTDNDVVSKLAHWRLLHHLPAIYSCTIAEIVALPSLVFRAAKAVAKPDKLFRDSETAAYALEFLSVLPEPGKPSGELLSELQTIPNIDAGEAVLLAIALSNDKSLFATGDKRAIKSIGDLQAEGKYLGLAGRAICLEQILTCMVKLLGFDAVQSSIRTDAHIDTATKMIWGSRVDAPPESVEEGFRSYIDDLISSAPSLLISEH